ncbi:hypothetical protein [Rhodopila sp.]|uniref:hypothetical protein n=1 Tax=Rhodopila sp. TaxID=2480087 RepID=UPI003D09BC83
MRGMASPGAPPIPSRGLISEPAMAEATRSNEAGNQAAGALVRYFVAQGVGLVDHIPTCRWVVPGFMTGSTEALEEMARLSETGE